MSEVKELTAYCEICEKGSDEGFQITEKQLAAAIRWGKSHGGPVLISCPYCGKAYQVDAEGLDLDNLKAWVVKMEEEEDSCCPCLPLRGMVAIEPVGRFEFPPKSGALVYKPGGAQVYEDYPDGLPRRVYMERLGYDPVILWSLMHPTPIKPVEIR